MKFDGDRNKYDVTNLPIYGYIDTRAEQPEPLVQTPWPEQPWQDPQSGWSQVGPRLPEAHMGGWPHGSWHLHSQSRHVACSPDLHCGQTSPGHLQPSGPIVDSSQFLHVHLHGHEPSAAIMSFVTPSSHRQLQSHDPSSSISFSASSAHAHGHFILAAHFSSERSGHFSHLQSPSLGCRSDKIKVCQH